MTNDTARVLASCLEAIEQQGLSLEECVAQHPEQRLTLSELLPVAQTLRAAPAVPPSLDFRLDAKQRLLTRLPPRLTPHAARRTHWLMLGRVALLLLVVVALAASAVTASAQALPKDVLYPVKRTIEQVRLALATDAVYNSDLHLMFAAERLNEMERLIDLGRGNDITVAIDDFAAQMQSVISIAQTMPDTAERAALIAHLAESIKSSDAILATTQARLPESAQGAITQTRAVLAERQNDLHDPARPAMPALAPGNATPDRAPVRQRTPAPSQTLPAVKLTRPVATPVWFRPPAGLPTPAVTPQPNRWPRIWPTRQVPRATSVPPNVIPSRLPSPAPTFKSPHFPVPVHRPRWSRVSPHH